MIAPNVLKDRWFSSFPKWLMVFLGIALIIAIGGIQIYRSNALHIEKDYEVKPHAYGRPGHAADEATVRLHVRQASEWWYNPST